MTTTTMPNANETNAIIAGLQSVRSRAPDITHKAIAKAIEHLAAQAAEIERLRALVVPVLGASDDNLHY